MQVLLFEQALLISLGPIMYFCTEISKAMPLLHKSYVKLMFRDAKITRGAFTGLEMPVLSKKQHILISDHAPTTQAEVTTCF